MAALASKRKREAGDMPQPRAAPGLSDNEFGQQYLHTDDDGMDHGDHDIQFAAALTHHNASMDDTIDQEHNPGQEQVNQNAGQSASDTAAAAMAQYHTMTVPQSTEQSFLAQAAEQTDRPGSSSVDGGNPQQRTSSYGDIDFNPMQKDPGSNGADASPTGGSGGNKPPVGTDEWHKLRRDNHKEVERRRRETINDGINELSKIVPGCEKNKGSILARAVQFINQLKENETQNIEKWTLEKLLTEQAIAELSSSCDKLKAECQRAWAECEQWKKAAQKAGITVDVDDKGDADAEDAD
ncbi:hypothetical protein PRZ48_003020 [Zasmidium cellare]|uniref:BHLH domain-containing protein n=1 Tax=Zasmidium cellare TaxID=395010 RepID=A0ABR0EU81_ZASCE|nr:hypothetical protein PRZ48_003020 [Zasmidium cellare]